MIDLTLARNITPLVSEESLEYRFPMRNSSNSLAVTDPITLKAVNINDISAAQ